MLCELCSAPERTNACVLCPPDIFPHAKTVPTWHLPTVIWYRSPLLADLTEPCLLHIFWWISKCSTCTRAKAKVQKHQSICKFSSEPRKKDQASQSIHMSIISAWEGLCGRLTASTLCTCFAWASNYKHQTSQASRISLYIFDLGRKVKVHTGREITEV